MAQRELIYIVSYDITSDRLRRRVGKQLSEVGARVQLSVFEVRLTKRSAEKLSARIAGHLEPGDSVRFYVIDPGALENSFSIGGPPMPERQDFWLV